MMRFTYEYIVKWISHIVMKSVQYITNITDVYWGAPKNKLAENNPKIGIITSLNPQTVDINNMK
jgi:hypothetical protein